MALDSCIDDVLHIIKSAGNDRDSIRWYKRDEGKAVFRFGNGFVAKVMEVRRFSQRLKYRRYAAGEAANLIIAADRGVPVPPVLAVGHLRRTGLVSHAIMMTREIANVSPLDELLGCSHGNAERIDALLSATLPLLERLYHAGCLHIDLHPGNILVNPHDLSQMPSVVDLKYARFFDRPSEEVLMFAAGRLVREGRGMISAASISRWIDALFDRLGLHDQAVRRHWLHRFQHYQVMDRSRKQRQRIRPYASESRLVPAQ